jgi:4-hydroxyacetophenone monooxygenase
MTGATLFNDRSGAGMRVRRPEVSRTHDAAAKDAREGAADGSERETAILIEAETVRAELREASDEAIVDAVAYADPMLLRGLIYQLTGDQEIAATAIALTRRGPLEVAAPATDADTAVLRRKAAEWLIAYRDGGAGEVSVGPRERLKTSLGLAVGEDLGDADMEFWIEELAIDPWARSLVWREVPEPARLQQFSVTVIGAGMGGLNAALQLKRAGVACRIVEKNSGVGGTWYENRYPGARVDTPSRAYTHTYGVDFPYPYSHCPWTENQRYFDWIADTFQLRDDIVFDTEVHSLTWDDDAAEWEICAEGSEGVRTWRSSAVITGVGFLNRPRIPEIDGMAGFRGSAWHSARWPQDVDIAGKRIAVIGSGCSGYQMVPEFARVAAHVTLFQRTASWLFPIPGYLSRFPPQVNWLDRNLPFHTNFMRFLAHYPMASAVAAVWEIDPGFDDPRAIGPANKRARDACISFLQEKLGDPELVRQMTPAVPVMSSRPVMVDSEYSVLDAILRENVSLVTEGIRRITAGGVETADGTAHEVDIIIYATGFHATNYLFPMSITGREGKTIEELWADGGARAYLGCMMPGFPNLWALYGPNTNGGLQPADFFEVTTHYALQCMEHLILGGTRSVEVKENAYWRYNHLLDERGARMAWSDPRAHSYYTSEHGRSITNCALSGTELWHLLHRPNVDDLTIR